MGYAYIALLLFIGPSDILLLKCATSGADPPPLLFSAYFSNNGNDFSFHCSSTSCRQVARWVWSCEITHVQKYAALSCSKINACKWYYKCISFIKSLWLVGKPHYSFMGLWSIKVPTIIIPQTTQEDRCNHLIAHTYTHIRNIILYHTATISVGPKTAFIMLPILLCRHHQPASSPYIPFYYLNLITLYLVTHTFRETYNSFMASATINTSHSKSTLIYVALRIKVWIAWICWHTCWLYTVVYSKCIKHWFSTVQQSRNGIIGLDYITCIHSFITRYSFLLLPKVFLNLLDMLGLTNNAYHKAQYTQFI